MMAFRFIGDGKHFENGAFRKWWLTMIMWLISCQSLPRTQMENDRWLLGFQIFPAEWTENIWWVFRVKNAVFKFRRCSADGDHRHLSLQLRYHNHPSDVNSNSIDITRPQTFLHCSPKLNVSFAIFSFCFWIGNNSPSEKTVFTLNTNR